MNVRILPHPLEGTLPAIPSKSMAHRLLICSALCQGMTDITCHASSQDIEATVRCLAKLGAPAAKTRDGWRMVPVTVGGPRRNARLDVGESGSTLRFLLPVVAALGTGASIVGHGRLAERPLAPLDEQLASHGITLTNVGSFPLVVEGKLAGGGFELPGSVSSQFVSGLLMAAPLMDEDVEVLVSEPVQSKGYIDLTIDSLATFGVHVDESLVKQAGTGYRRYFVRGGQQLKTPGALDVEGDWSNAAFWLAAGTIGPTSVAVNGLNAYSRQGDRAIMAALSLLGAHVSRGHGLISSTRDHLRGRTIDVSAIPDLAAPLAAVAAVASGETRLANAGRLRLKESDRLETIRAALVAMGGNATIEGDDLVIHGVETLEGGTVDAANDHRIAMMAAICAAYATGPTTICGAECVSKSYPAFLDDFSRLGGITQACGG